MIAQTFTPSIHFCSLSPAHAHTNKHAAKKKKKKSLQVIAIIVTTSLTQAGKEKRESKGI